MISKMETEQVETIDRKQGAANLLDTFQRQLAKIDRIDELMTHRPQTAVHDLAETETGTGFHAASSLRRCASRGTKESAPPLCQGALQPNEFATFSPDFKPSSWKP